MIPYCCPVCNGKGIVPNGFYTSLGNMGSSTNASPEKCRSCNGTGIIWSNNSPDYVEYIFLPCGSANCRNPHEKVYRGCKECKYNKLNIEP